VKPNTKEAIKLLYRGQRALAEIEFNGVAVDVDYLESAIKGMAHKIEIRQAILKGSPVWLEWKKRFGQKANLNSLPQFGKLLYGVLGFKIDQRELTKTGQPKMTEEVLSRLDSSDLPFLKKYQDLRKLLKIKSTYLDGLKREMIDGFVHPGYSLNLSLSHRSGCSRPNFQNQPVRNKKLAEMVRRCYKPRHPDHCIVEVDYGGIEVKVSACYNKDPVLLKYIKDKTTDMHRDMAMECYLLSKEEVSKDSRYCAKNKYVFPQFYGSYYVDCAKALWHAIDQLKLTTNSGVPLEKHLARNGIKSMGACLEDCDPRPGTFEYHIKQVEKKFWNERFAVYSKWKKEWYNKYLERGYFDLLTGFRCDSPMRRNQVINIPVQGSAFHLALWSMPRILEELEKAGLKRCLMVGEIHDSILFDCHKDEVKKLLAICHKVMVEEVRKHFSWIIVPLEIEADVAPRGRSWHEKAPMEIAA
jgi:DNA polymerase-1